MLARIFQKIYRKISGDNRAILFPKSLIQHFQDPAQKKVFILTFCRDEKQLYGTTLIFDSLRRGFPNAVITVVDNASLPSVRGQIRELAEKAKCHYFQLESEVPHSVYLEDLIMNQPIRGTVINLDPDIILWENCENWRFQALLAGSLVPSYIGELSHCITRPRIHSSFYWMQDIQKLREKIMALQKTFFEFNPFLPIMFKESGKWYRYDTGGTLYAAIKEECYLFGPKEQNSFDHIFGGTHLNLFVKGIKNKKVKQQITQAHKLAKTNPDKLRGIWKTQLKYLKKP